MAGGVAAGARGAARQQAYTVEGQRKIAVADISFEVFKGEFVCVVGPQRRREDHVAAVPVRPHAAHER